MADLITLKEARVYLQLDDADENDLLEPIVAHVSTVIRQELDRDIDQRAYTIPLNGNGLRALRVRNRPVAVSPAPTVTENGTSLVVSTGYSETADVVVDLAEATFYRMASGATFISGTRSAIPGRWAPGVQNVVIGYTGGFATGFIPSDLVLLAKWMVGFAWHHPDRQEIGLAGRTSAGGTINFLEDLPKFYQKILDRHRDLVDWPS